MRRLDRESQTRRVHPMHRNQLPACRRGRRITGSRPPCGPASACRPPPELPSPGRAWTWRQALPSAGSPAGGAGRCDCFHTTGRTARSSAAYAGVARGAIIPGGQSTDGRGPGEPLTSAHEADTHALGSHEGGVGNRCRGMVRSPGPGPRGCGCTAAQRFPVRLAESHRIVHEQCAAIYRLAVGQLRHGQSLGRRRDRVRHGRHRCSHERPAAVGRRDPCASRFANATAR